MTQTLRVVCRPALQDGFSLAGVNSVAAGDPIEAAAVLTSLVDQPELGVLLVEEELYLGLPEPLRDTLERRPLPVVVPFPGPRRGERPSAEAALVELLRRAIGYRVRLR
jgi:vacuolar-type H+-ATPase subunit F/Vma7